MQLNYTNTKDQGYFTLNDFSCVGAEAFLKENLSFKIIWVRTGQIDVEVDGISVTLQEKQIMFLTPRHQLTLPKISDAIVSFSFNKEFYCIHQFDHEVSCEGLLFYGSVGVPIIDLAEHEHQSFLFLYNEFKIEFGQDDKNQGEMLRLLLKQLLIKSVRLTKRLLQQPEMDKQKLNLVRKYNVLVEEHFRSKHKVKDYADLLFKSPKTLSNVFKLYNDKSPLQIINERILLEAKRFLLFTSKSAKEIALELGYEDPAHFSKFFKKQTGISISEFKSSQ